MPPAVQAETEAESGLNRAARRRRAHNERRYRGGLRPALIPISDGADYIGVARSTFYARFLPHLETVRIGRRRMVVLESLDQLVEQLRGRDAG